MDNNLNQTGQQNQPQTQPVAPVQPTAFPDPQPTTNIPQPALQKKGPPIIWIASGLIILIIILAAGYFYLGQTSTSTPKLITAPQATPETQTSIESLEVEVDEMDVATDGAEFMEVDKDLQSL